MPPSSRARPVVLTVAGSDSSCGAGAQADLKTFQAHGCYGLTSITCVVSEVPGRVEEIRAMPPRMVSSQTRLSLEAFPVAAAKTGMLFSATIVKAVAACLQHTKIPLVVDPVMVASSGDALLELPAISAYKTHLFPLATVVTPNLDELSLLVGYQVKNQREMRKAGIALSREFGCAFLVKGGHLRGDTAIDILVRGEECDEFASPFVRGVSTHGTGCTYSAAIAAGLAKGLGLRESVASAKRYVTAAISGTLRWGITQALDHAVEVRSRTR